MTAHVYRGRVVHQRRTPRPHAFSYTAGLIGLDLEALPQLIGARAGFGLGRPGLLRFRRADFLPQRPGPLAMAVRELVAERTGHRPTGRVELVTTLRSAGIGFNPVSFYLCHGGDGDLAAIVAEITNTPWNERHCYVLPRESARIDGDSWYFEFDKHFHISPFHGMAQHYRWRFLVASTRLHVQMHSSEAGRVVFTADLDLERRAATPARLTRHALAQLATPLRVLAAIYWQAFRLWRKRTPFHPHPASRPRPAPVAGQLRSAA